MTIAPELTDAADGLKSLLARVKTRVLERDELIDLIGLSLVAGQHIFVAGPPGVAKSTVFYEIFAGIEGAKQGFFALTKGSTPEMVVGPMSPRALKEEDKFKFNVEGMLPDVDLALIDEVFKGNALTRHAMLQVLNERIFFNGGEIVSCPLLMAGATSNEYPDAKEDAAFFDRFLIRYEVGRLASHEHRTQMITMRTGRSTPEPVVSMQEIRSLHEAHFEVTITDDTMQVFHDLYAELVQNEVVIGDRRLDHTFSLVRANALLNGRSETEPADLRVFAHTAWSLPEQRKPIRKLVERVLNWDLAKISDMYDEIEIGFETFLRERSRALEANDGHGILTAFQRFGDAAGEHITEMKEQIQKQAEKGKDTSEAVRLLRQAEARVQESMVLSISRDK